MPNHETNNNLHTPDDDIFAQFEADMSWQPDDETQLALSALDHKTSIGKQRKILEVVREVHQRELSEAGVLYRALERLPGADAGQNARFISALTAGTGEIYLLATRDGESASRRVSVGRIEKHPGESDRCAPNKGFQLSDVKLMVSQFRQLEELKKDGTLPDLMTTGLFDIHDISTSIMRKP